MRSPALIAERGLDAAAPLTIEPEGLLVAVGQIVTESLHEIGLAHVAGSAGMLCVLKLRVRLADLATVRTDAG